MSYRFFPPQVEEGSVAYRNDFEARLRWSKGISLITGDGGLFEEVRYFQPLPDWVEGRDYFVGGHHYSGIPQEVADLLILSGYEPELEE